MTAIFARILCPIDFERDSMDALELACRLAKQNSATVYLLTVIGIPPAAATEQLNRKHLGKSEISDESNLDRTESREVLREMLSQMRDESRKEEDGALPCRARLSGTAIFSLRGRAGRLEPEEEADARRRRGSAAVFVVRPVVTRPVTRRGNRRIDVGFRRHVVVGSRYVITAAPMVPSSVVAAASMVAASSMAISSMATAAMPASAMIRGGS
jgi:nucleotide-binding universal stress UspA family protein